MPTDSKERLLEKATAIFADRGYTETSTREIARAADVNISAIAYYFGGKQGLYRAVLENIVHGVRTAVDETIESAVAVLSDKNSTPEQAETALCGILKSLGELLYSTQLPDEAVTVFLHEYANPGEAFSTLYEGLIFPIHKIFADLIIKATAATDNATIEEITLYTFPLFASLFSFKVRKQTVLKHVKWQDYGNKEIDTLISLMIKQTRSIIALYKKETKDKADG